MRAALGLQELPSGRCCPTAFCSGPRAEESRVSLSCFTGKPLLISLCQRFCPRHASGHIWLYEPVCIYENVHIYTYLCVCADVGRLVCVCGVWTHGSTCVCLPVVADKHKPVCLHVCVRSQPACSQTLLPAWVGGPPGCFSPGSTLA